MKTKKIRIILIAIPAVMLLAFWGRQVNAQEYLTVYMDSVNEMDTIYGCDTYDSIKLVPNSGSAISKFWIVCDFDLHYYDCDTIFPDTLYLPATFRGLVSFQAYDGMNPFGSWVNLKPLSFFGENKIVSCGGENQLNVYTNYSGPGNPEYSWTPSSGLSDTTIPNPAAYVTCDMEYTVTLNAPNGCSISENISVMVQPFSSIPICLVSVDNTNKNIIYWDKPESVPVDSFFIYKEKNVTDIYEKIGAVSYSDDNVFIDTSSNAQIQSNKYKISLKDSCGLESAGSEPHKTMHLSLNQGFNNVWNLIWEPYIGIPVSTYYIYRGTTPTNLQLIGTTSGSNTQFSDLTAPAGHVHYQIEIVSPNECNVPDAGLKSTSLAINTSRSNMVSFTPSGISERITNPVLFYVYPNPAREMLYIESNQKDITNGEIELCNIEGRILYAAALKTSKAQLTLSDLESGLYILRIKTDKSMVIKKIAKD